MKKLRPVLRKPSKKQKWQFAVTARRQKKARAAASAGDPEPPPSEPNLLTGTNGNYIGFNDGVAQPVFGTFGTLENPVNELTVAMFIEGSGQTLLTIVGGATGPAYVDVDVGGDVLRLNFSNAGSGYRTYFANVVGTLGMVDATEYTLTLAPEA